MSDEVIKSETVAERTTKLLGIVSMVFGIISLPLTCVACLGMPCAICGFVLGIIALSRKPEQKIFSVVGVITSIIGMLISLLPFVTMFMNMM